MTVPISKLPISAARLLSLDVIRGLTILCMILVNSPGNATPYAWLEHSEWNGCTFADLVFPFFIFILGVSVVFSLAKVRAEKIPVSTLMMKVFRRAVILILLGLFLNAFPKHFDFSTLRFFGVLQRIGVCYFFAALIFLTTGVRMQLGLFFGFLVAYWLLMIAVPVPGFGVGNLSQLGNLAAYLDRLVFSSVHLYGKIFDPEGFLSTLPALSSALLGVLTGKWLMTHYSMSKKLVGMIIAGVLAMLLGWLWGLSFPLNKALWTSSFVLWTGGFALLVFGFYYWVLEMRQWRRWSLPLEIFGVNAIAAYFLHIFFIKLQHMVVIPNADGTSGNLRAYITTHAFGWAGVENASLLYSVGYVALWFVVLAVMYRKRVFLKI